MVCSLRCGWLWWCVHWHQLGCCVVALVVFLDQIMLLLQFFSEPRRQQETLSYLSLLLLSFCWLVFKFHHSLPVFALNEMRPGVRIICLNLFQWHIWMLDLMLRSLASLRLWPCVCSVFIGLKTMEPVWTSLTSSNTVWSTETSSSVLFVCRASSRSEPIRRLIGRLDRESTLVVALNYYSV